MSLRAYHPNREDDTAQPRERERDFLTARAIDPAVAAERGYVTAPDNLRALGFSETQAALGAGLLIPVHDIDGDIAYPLFRPDTPRLTDNGKAGPKYEVPAGQRLVLDVHPRVRPVLGNPSIPLLIAESAPKADSVISRGYAAVSLNGVWGWRHTNASGGKTIIPDFEAVALNDRVVTITFDSDVWTNHHVADAVERLGAFLARKAKVRVCRIPPMPDGKKQGVDDYIAAGGDLGQLLANAVPFGRFIDERPRATRSEHDDVDYWKSRALAAEDRHRQFMHAMRCPDPSIRKAVPTLAAIHYAYDSAVARDASADPRILRSLAPDGSMRITRRTIAEISGRSEGTITNDLALLESHGCLTRDVTRLFPGDVDPDTGEIVTQPRSIMRVTPARSAVANFRYAQSIPKPDATINTGWGGARSCKACGSKRLELICLDCGHHQPATPEKPTQTLKVQDAFSGSLDTDTTKTTAVAAVGRTTTAPHISKKSNLHFQEIDAPPAPLKTHVGLSPDEILARRRELRHPRPVSAPALKTQLAPSRPVPLEERIFAAVKQGTAQKRPLHEDEVAGIVGAQPRDVRPVMQSLAVRRIVKRWDDGYVTAIGAD